MTFYIAAMIDVIASIETAHSSATYVEPPSTADKSINYFQLFEELKSINSLIMLCTFLNTICTCF